MATVATARNRIVYAGLTVGVLLAGFASRRFFSSYSFVKVYVGDVLWAMMIFLGFAFVFSKGSTRTIATAALAFCVSIELSQLYHAAWIDRVRATTLGGLVLGYSFGWSDLVCYALGIGLGALIDKVCCNRLFNLTIK